MAAADLKAAGNRFYARFSLTQEFTDTTVAVLADAGWTPLVTTNDLLPNGAPLFYIRAFDVNHKGDVAFTGTVQVSASEVIVVRRQDGSLHQVYINSDPTDPGDYLLRFGVDLNLRDDGRVFFTGFDVKDRPLIYEADPLQG